MRAGANLGEVTDTFDAVAVDAALEAKSINVIRALGMDGPHAARSGHQGTAMALAPAAHVLWSRVMRYDAGDPNWPDRDRFILSPGHASILLYAGLHLTGHGLTLDDLKNFRQWDSATPGHPEVGHTAGVEITTGPLGQGFASAVGMAIAEERLRALYGPEICDHHIYGFCSDGDLAEGVSHEAASLAGHLKLGRLVFIYDDNHVSIDGPTELALSDDAAKRFEAYGWHVQDLGEAGEDLDAIEAAVKAGRDHTDAPSLIILRTHIGYPSPSLTDSPSAHGLAFGDEEITEAKAAMDLPDEPFHIPDEVLSYYREVGARGAADRQAWQARYDSATAETRDGFDLSLTARPAAGGVDALPTFDAGEKLATRKAIQACLEALVPSTPSMMVGSADLGGSTGTKLAGAVAFDADHRDGTRLYFGIREHAMGAILNGAALHGGVLPVAGTFLVFSDYMRGAVRLAAITQAKSLFIWTHDSIGVGEDGPTHQPVEHVSALRAIPDFPVARPADANEVAHVMRRFVDDDAPLGLILTRQGVPVLEETAGAAAAANVARGGYVLFEPEDIEADITLLATGSEVSLCMAGAELLAADGVVARVVSMPCVEWFEDQPVDYQRQVLGDSPILAVEAGVPFGWHRYADDVLGLDRFGASAPGSEVMTKLGFTPEAVRDRAKALI